MKAAPRPRPPATPSRPGPARPRTAEPTDAFTLGLQRRLRKVLGLLPEVRTAEDPDAVHDLRVWSRRLQQGLDAVYPKPRPRRVRKVRRQLRRLRRALGEWRNLDVVLAGVAARRRRARVAPRRRAWALVSDGLRRQRRREIAQARKRLERVDPEALEHAVMRLIEEARGSTPAGVRHGVREALEAWSASRQAAAEVRRIEELHAFRVATKRLRYRVELARDLGDLPPDGALSWMKRLQDRLGDWHDRQVLCARTAEALARPHVLLEEPEALRAALDDLEREARVDVDEILRSAADPGLSDALRPWLTG